MSKLEEKNQSTKKDPKLRKIFCIRRQEEGGKLTTGEREEVTGIGLGEEALRERSEETKYKLEFSERENLQRMTGIGLGGGGNYEGSEEETTQNKELIFKNKSLTYNMKI